MLVLDTAQHGINVNAHLIADLEATTTAVAKQGTTSAQDLGNDSSDLKRTLKSIWNTVLSTCKASGDIALSAEELLDIS